MKAAISPFLSPIELRGVPSTEGGARQGTMEGRGDDDNEGPIISIWSDSRPADLASNRGTGHSSSSEPLENFSVLHGLDDTSFGNSEATPSESSKRSWLPTKQRLADFPSFPPTTPSVIAPWGHVWRFIQQHSTFYRLHLTYYLLLTFIGTFTIWWTPGTSVGRLSFLDALYSSMSAVTVTGMVSVYMGQFSTFHLCVLMALMILGGQIFTSLLPVLIRRYYFHERIKRYTMSVETSRLHEGKAGEKAPVVPLPTIQENNVLPEDVLLDKSYHGNLDHSLHRGLLGDFNALGDKASGTSLSDTSTDNSSGSTPSLTSTVTMTSSNNLAKAAALLQPRGAGTATTGISGGPSRHVERPIARDISAVETKLRGLSFQTQEDVRAFGSALEKANKQFAGGVAGKDEEEHEDEGSYPHSFTWSGETARTEARRLKRALDLIREQKLLKEGGQEESEAEDQSRLTGGAEDVLIDPSKLRTLEYRALCMLSWLVPAYLIGLSLLAFLAILISFVTSRTQTQILSLHAVNSVFFSAFQTVSALQCGGLTLLDDSLIEFDTAIVPVFTSGVLMLLGNTLYAPTMRGIIYGMHRWDVGDSDVTKYLLDHPRKCFTHLFPWHTTCWLVITVIAFNLVEFVFFCALDWNNASVTTVPPGFRTLDGVFQSLQTRNAGFVVFGISGLSPAMLVLYIGMMYVAVYPVFLSRQTSREKSEVYDDSSDPNYHNQEVGVYKADTLNDQRFWTQSRRLVGTDAAFIFLSIFIICLIHSSDIQNEPKSWSIFNIMFEVISAYGNVGLSLGYSCPDVQPGQTSTCVSPPYSFSGVWKPAAKVLVILLMLMGRHRGLPDNIDPAVTIPEAMQFKPGKRRKLKEISAAELFNFPHEVTIKPGRRPNGNFPPSPNFFRKVSERLGGQSPNDPSSSLDRWASLPTAVSMSSASGGLLHARSNSPSNLTMRERRPSMPNVLSGPSVASPSRRNGNLLPRSQSEPELIPESKQGYVLSPV